MIFSIILCNSVGVSAASELVASYTFDSFYVSGKTTKSNASSLDAVADNYTCTSPRLIFKNTDGTNLTLMSGNQYRITLNATSSLTVGGSDGNCHVVAQYYMIYAGQKYYFTDNTLQVYVDGANSAYFTVGVDFYVTVWGGGACTPKVTFSKIIQSIYKYTGDSSMTAGESAINNSIASGNKLQEEQNTLQEEQNSLQEEANTLQEEANETSRNIFDKISDFFAGFFDGIINALKSVFIPEDGYFSDFFTRLNDFFSEKLGMLYAPIDMFITFMTELQNATGGDAGIQFPGIKWEDAWLIEPQTVSLTEYADEMPELQEKIYFVTDVMMIGAVLWLLQVKLKEVLQN